MIELASKADAALLATLEGEIAAKIKSKTGALHVLVGMIHSHGIAAINAMPLVGSHKNTSNNYDEYDVFETNTKGEQKKKTRSQFANYYDATTLGRKDYQMITLLADAKTDNPKADTKSQMAALYKGKPMSSADLDSEHGYWQTHRSEGRNLIKRSMKLHQKIAYVRENMPKVDVRFALLDYQANGGGDKSITLDNLRKTNKPIIVFEKQPPYSAWSKSIGTFLSFDVAKAIRDGGNAGDLVNSATRKSNKQTTLAPKIADVKQFGEYAAEMSAFADPTGSHYRTLATVMADVKTDGAFVLSVSRLSNYLESLCVKAEKRIADLEAAEIAKQSGASAVKVVQKAINKQGAAA